MLRTILCVSVLLGYCVVADLFAQQCVLPKVPEPPKAEPAKVGTVFVVGSEMTDFGFQILQKRKPYIFYVPDFKSESELVPPANPVTPWRLLDNVEQVPELTFLGQGQLGQGAADAQKKIAMRLAQIRYLDSRQEHGFLATVEEHRPDLRGLPFLRGPECRMPADVKASFPQEVAAARTMVPIVAPLATSGRISTVSITAPPALLPPATPPTPATLVVDQAMVTQAFVPVQFPAPRTQIAATPEDPFAGKADAARQARTRAAMQVLCADGNARTALVRQLQGIAHVETTAGLAKMAIFAPESAVRQAAILALGLRREKDYDDVLLAAFRYPLPAISDHAADAILRLKRTDLLPRLVDVLDLPDPREPAPPDGARPAQARELVKVNHHRNCMLCHAPHPADVSLPADKVWTVENVAGVIAPVPNPHEGLPSGSGYDTPVASPDLSIRIDVTYLRQDFSLMLAVKDSAPWPAQQRFDFLVNTRTLTDAEWTAFQAQVKERPTGYVAPHHRAALRVLRELTGLDAAPTAAAWRPVVAQALARR